MELAGRSRSTYGMSSCWLVVIGLALAVPANAQVALDYEVAAKDCPVSLPTRALGESGPNGLYGTPRLSVLLPVNGIQQASERVTRGKRQGHVSKFPFSSDIDQRVARRMRPRHFISARKVGAPGRVPLQYVHRGYGGGVGPIAPLFPSLGCWKATSGIGRVRLEFTVFLQAF
jgi:hypothetical protein